jgi:hypothetical protein
VGDAAAGRLRLGKQTLCQLSYSRSGGPEDKPRARQRLPPAAWRVHLSIGEPGSNAPGSGFELDICAVIDGHLVIGEAKKNASFVDRDQARLRKAALSMRAAYVVFSSGRECDGDCSSSWCIADEAARLILGYVPGARCQRAARADGVPQGSARANGMCPDRSMPPPAIWPIRLSPTDRARGSEGGWSRAFGRADILRMRQTLRLFGVGSATRRRCCGSPKTGEGYQPESSR